MAKIKYIEFNGKEHDIEVLNGFSIMEGAIQCYNYLLKEKRGFLCSYIHKWSYLDYIHLRIKRLFCLILLYSFYFFENYSPIVFGKFYNSNIFNYIKSMFKNCSKDFILHNCL